MIQPDKLTHKTQEALQQSFQFASEKNQQAIDVVHLFLALISQEDSLIVSILKKLDVSVAELESQLKESLAKVPEVVGATGQHYLTDELNKVLNQADKEAGKMKDEFISTEHILLGILNVKSEVQSILKSLKVSFDDVLKALTEIRGGLIK